jgi:hypothetical protein
VNVFGSKVDKNLGGGCWIWMGNRNPNNYGQFSVGPRGNFRRTGAHRFAWEFTYGSIPDGLGICHRCDNPPCVRPDHLFLGDQLVNMQDAKAKGRISPPPLRYGDDHWTRARPDLLVVGENHGNAKLTDAQVLEIRATFKPGIRGQKAEFARRFGVSATQIWRILAGASRAA